MNDAIQSVSTDDHSENPLLVIEDSLQAISAVARLLGHICGGIMSGREVGEEELSSLHLILDTAHANIDVHWKRAFEYQRLVQKEHKEVLATVTAELTAERAKHGAPGSIADVEHARFCWRMLRGAAQIAMQECDKSDPRSRSPSKKKRRGRAST